MQPLDAAVAAREAISGIASHFMLDMGTYAHGASLGFDGVDFYTAGRGGVLGEVPAAVVAAAFVFWNPDTVRDSWERSAPVMSRHEAAVEFAAVAHRWAEAHVPADFDAARLAELAGRISDAASVACAPLFAGWRELAEPDPDRPAALAVHRMNALRELQGARHGAAVVSRGIDLHAAVAHRSPVMLGIFGWAEPHPDGADVRDGWAEAQAATDVAMAPAFEALTPSERDEFVELANALQAAATAP